MAPSVRSSLLAAAALAGALMAGPAAAQAQTLTFTPVADTYVSSSAATTNYGKSADLWTDASPSRKGYLRFNVSGTAGLHVTGVRLRMYQRDKSPAGGDVYSISSNTWSESATNYDNRPAIDGPLRASFGSVAAKKWYTVALSSGAVGADGLVSFAVSSRNSDGASWASRETSNKPQLLVDVTAAPPSADGLSQVAAPALGSSDPTYYAGEHRLAATAGGRVLALYGKHLDGVQLAWRDGAGAWQTATTGRVSDGRLLQDTGTGDWPASIAVARDSSGAEHAWVVWSGYGYSKLRPVQMVRLSNLDSPSGPSVGPIETIDDAPYGAYRADIGFERAADGTLRGCVLWAKRTDSGSTNFQMLTGWFTDLDSDTPSVHDLTAIYNGGLSSRFGTLVPVAGGIKAVAKGGNDWLRTYSHDGATALTSWSAGSGTITVPGGVSPAAVALSSGDVVAAVDTDTTNHVITVQRFSATGAPSAPELQLTGYAQPTLATDGSNVWLVSVRQSDGYLVSREFVAGSGWTAADRVEAGAEGGGNYQWPNALRDAQGKLRFITRGPVGPTADQNAVLFLQRAL